MEIGSYDGFFIKDYISFKKIILTDLTPYSNLYPNDPKFEFILLNGMDLENVMTSSSNVIFSIDTLVKLEKNILSKYFRDFGRIISPNGYLIVHIPDFLTTGLFVMSFTRVSRFFFSKCLKKYFDDIIYTDELHSLGTFLIAKRNDKPYQQNSK